MSSGSGPLAAHPRNGKKKLAKPTATASFHLSLNTCGSSSSTGKERRDDCSDARKKLHPFRADRRSDDGPMISWAIVPTTISKRKTVILQPQRPDRPYTKTFRRDREGTPDA
jgi:hypothetical protein